MSVSVNQVTMVMVKHPVKVSSVVRDIYTLIVILLDYIHLSVYLIYFVLLMCLTCVI